MMRTLLAALCFTLAALAAHGDEVPYLFKDLPGKTVLSSYSTFWTNVGNLTWFVADYGTGKRLWTTDGTSEGTQMVSSITRADVADSKLLGILNGRFILSAGLFVLALDPSTGEIVELGRTEGHSTEDGVLFNGRLYFSGYARQVGSTVQVLWQTDGTKAGTMFTHFVPNSRLSSMWKSPVVLGDAMYFCGKSTAGDGLHRTDGTVAGTTLVQPLSGLEASHVPIAVIGGRLVFAAPAAQFGPILLWSSDGTSAGTAPLSNELTNMRIDVSLMFGGMLLFRAETPERRNVIGITDGTQAGTRILVSSSQEPALESILPGAALGSRYFFYADRSISAESQRALYVTDGTSDGTKIILEHKMDGIGGGFVIGNRFYFSRHDPVYGAEPWSVDGTTGAMEMLADIEPGFGSSGGAVQAFRRPDGKLLFHAYTSETGAEPWITDGTPSGTKMVKNIGVDDPMHGSKPEGVRAGTKSLFFAAHLPRGFAVGRSDGTRAGTFAESVVPKDWFTAGNPVVAGDRYFFFLDKDLMASDASAAGTFLLHRKVLEGSLYPVGEGVLFPALSETFPQHLELWWSDGTPAGTRRLRAFDGIPLSSRPVGATNGRFAWYAVGHDLWRTDGTMAGTTPVYTSKREMSWVAALGEDVIIAEEEESPSDAKVLRRLTRHGAVTDLATLERLPTSAFSLGSMLVFIAGQDLWRTDGTAAGTILLRSRFSSGGLRVQEAAVLGNALFLRNSFEGVTRLTKTDGTVAGTSTIHASPSSKDESWGLAANGGKLYFCGWDPIHGAELWVSDGTEAGTRLLYDIYPGFPPSSPKDFTAFGDRVYFSAWTFPEQKELWAIDTPPARKRRAAGK